MLISSPIEKQIVSKLDPPELMSGRVIPVIGINPTVTPVLTTS
jgi:hypothetical protein